MAATARPVHDRYLVRSGQNFFFGLSTGARTRAIHGCTTTRGGSNFTHTHTHTRRDYFNMF